MTANQVTNVGHDLIRLLSQQHMLYRQLRDLARKQTELVEGGDPEALLRILAGRQRLIDRLAAIDRELEPIRADWRRIADALPPAQRAEAEELLGQVQQILGEILAQDQRDSQSLCDQRRRITGQIRDTAAGKRMNRAYGQDLATSARYFDTRTE